MRDVQEPTLNEHGDEVHPAFGFIHASRITSNPPQVLFDSDIKHSQFVRIQVTRAKRKRDLHRDWLFGTHQSLIEVVLSEAQWASFVSSMNTSGVSCTLTRTEKDGDLPGLPYDPRLAASTKEVHEAADEAFARIKEAMATYEGAKTAGNLRNLKSSIENATGNVDFASKQLVEHAENVVEKSRADIEAMLVTHARQLGIDTATVENLLELEG